MNPSFHIERNIKKDRIVLPIELTSKVLQRKWQNAYALYVVLQACTNGIFMLSKDLLKILQCALGYRNVKSVINQLDKLIELEWIGHNSKTGWFHIRSLNSLLTVYEIDSLYSSVYFPKEHKNIKAFFYGSVIGYLAYRQRKMKWDFSGREKRRPIPKNLKGFYPLALIYIAAKLECSVDTASRWKNIAKDAGYIDVLADYSTACFRNHSEFKFARSYSPYGERLRRIKSGPEKGEYGYRTIDLISPKGLVFKPRKKSYEKKETNA